MLRHNMAGALQPLAMMSAMLERHLQKSTPDLPAVALKSSQMNTLVREASTHCLDVMSWLAPKPNEVIAAAAGIEDAVGLVLNELLFRGFTVVNQTGDVQARLPRGVTQNVLLVALVALTDAATAPANVILDAQRCGDELVLTMSIQPTRAELLLGGVPAYRNLDWDDLQAVADAESVRVVQITDRVELHCPVAA